MKNVKTYLQLISLKKKRKIFSQSTICKSFHKSPVHFDVKKKSFQILTIHFD